MGSYEKNQIKEVIENSDEKYGYNIKIYGSGGETKYMKVNKAKLKRIMSII